MILSGVWGDAESEAGVSVAAALLNHRCPVGYEGRAGCLCEDVEGMCNAAQLQRRTRVLVALDNCGARNAVVGTV